MQTPDPENIFSISLILRQYNLHPDPDGLVYCPFHKGDMPTMKIDLEKDWFECPVCEIEGDGFDFVMMKERPWEQAEFKKQLKEIHRKLFPKKKKRWK